MRETFLMHAIAVFLLAATPVSELRGAVPLGIGVFSMPAALVMLLAFVGNLVPIAAVYALGGWWLSWTSRRDGFLRRVTDATVDRARRAFTEKQTRYGAWALPFFVAVPLPLTGAFTGALAAFVFGVPFRKAFPLIAIGVAMADIAVTLAATGALAAFSFVHP